MQTTSISLIRFRLPISPLKTLTVGFLIIFLYIVVIAFCFVLQNSLENIIGINPAKVPIAYLMVVIFIPFGVFGWWLMKKNTRYANLQLLVNSLTITPISEGEGIKTYRASDIAFVKMQVNSFHVTFKDGYRFNILDMGMGKGYGQEMIAFMPVFQNFIQQNGVLVWPENISGNDKIEMYNQEI